jgi:MinD-like ATPase involved in chromosome partitioning or flagellar assembly
MSTLHVTIRAPDSKLDLTVPADLPIGKLMPSLLEMAGLDTGNGSPGDWAIAQPGADPLPLERTLADCGVPDGAVLAFHLAARPVAGEADEQPLPAAAGPPTPTTGATALGPPSAAPTEVNPAVTAAASVANGEIASNAAGANAAGAGAAGAALVGPDQRPEEDEFDPGPGLPLARSRYVLPERLGFGERLLTAARAALVLDHYEEPPDGAHPRVDRAAALRRADVRAAPATTPLDQWRASWRRTDYVRRLEAATMAPRLRRCVAIGVISPKGGVGKTTITALLGALLSYTRQDRVVAIDAEPDYGSLGSVVTPDHEFFVDDVLDILDEGDLTVAELSASLGRGPDGLMVLPAPNDPSRLERLDAYAYSRVITHLKQKAEVVLLDCGTELQEPSTQAAIRSADQLLLISDADPSTATLVAQAAKLLRISEAPMMLLVNKLPRRSAQVDLDALGSLVPDAAGMWTVESDPATSARVADGTLTWKEPVGRCGVSIRELACLVASQWPALGLASPVPRVVSRA